MRYATNTNQSKTMVNTCIFPPCRFEVQNNETDSNEFDVGKSDSTIIFTRVNEKKYNN